ncbi:MAG: ATP-dependent DNA ligase [Burkholderiales bacterium]|nr:ATP-dependent DNA ligase [Burkholderiales bacterium]
MRRFAALYQALDASTATGAKLAALVAYLRAAPPDDAAWAVSFLAGGRPRQVVPTALVRRVARELAGLPEWLFDASYQAAGDLAETIALVLPPPRRASDEPLAHWVGQRLLPLRGQPPELQAAALREAFDELDAGGRFLLVKLIGGGFRVGVARLLVQRAVAELAGLDPKEVALRMMGWADSRAAPDAARWRELVAPHAAATDAGRPYPFFLAHPLQADPAALGPVGGWIAEWKYDGVRAQIVRRAGQAWIWSRGEELVTERFPEAVEFARALPDGSVLDGELVAWRDGDDRPAPFALLQRRLGRKTLTRRLLAELPVRFLAFDLLELDGADWRARPQHERRAALAALLPASQLAPVLDAADWATLAARREEARRRGVEGLMLKQRDARYGQGRTRADGVWWKWKLDPLRVDAVLVHAQAGHGRRAGLYTDYGFALWNRAPRDAAEAAAVVDAIVRRAPPDPQGLQLVPFAKAYSGLTDAEFRAVDREIRAQTLDKFGPVRSVRPTLVFEIGFEGVQPSARHRSGLAVRFPRMLRIRHDKPLHEADSLPALRALLDPG